MVSETTCLGDKLFIRLTSSDPEKDGELCYIELQWIQTWMNIPSIKRSLGANPQLTFQSCTTDVGEAFGSRGDGMRNSAALLPELIDNGVRLLVYAGNTDMGCNFIVRVCAKSS